MSPCPVPRAIRSDTDEPQPTRGLERGRPGRRRADVRAVILARARQALDEDGAEVICLGCAGMAGLDKELERELGVPVLDGVACALKLLEGLLGYGLTTSKRRAYATPLAKALPGLPAVLGAPYSGAAASG